MLNSVLNDDKNSQLQIDCVSYLNNIFVCDELNNILIKNYAFKGVRGKFSEKNNYALNFTFIYFGYKFEFILTYDQLEYYISKKNELLFECNLEDFWDDKILLEKFITYLKIDLKKLKVKFNG